MIKTGRFDEVSIGGYIDDLLVEYDSAGRAIMRGAIAEGYDERVLRVVFEACFSMVTEVLEKEEK